jgi:hypothetical protein
MSHFEENQCQQPCYIKKWIGFLEPRGVKQASIAAGV